MSRRSRCLLSSQMEKYVVMRADRDAITRGSRYIHLAMSKEIHPKYINITGMCGKREFLVLHHARTQFSSVASNQKNSVLWSSRISHRFTITSDRFGMPSYDGNDMHRHSTGQAISSVCRE